MKDVCPDLHTIFPKWFIHSIQNYYIRDGRAKKVLIKSAPQLDVRSIPPLQVHIWRAKLVAMVLVDPRLLY